MNYSPAADELVTGHRIVHFERGHFPAHCNGMGETFMVIGIRQLVRFYRMQADFIRFSFYAAIL